jgi:hypothetical protein
MSASAAVNRRTLWILVGIGAALFLGSILFIISRAH